MTLLAMLEDKSLFSPSLLVSGGMDRLMMLQIAGQNMDKFFCPHCFSRTGEMVNVHFRRGGETRRDHFYHLGENNGSECRNYSSESEMHLTAKDAIAKRLTSNGLADVELEVRLQTPGIAFAKPDITAYQPNGAMEAHEVQISPISLEGLQRRTEQLKAHGAAIVHWYFYGSNWSRDHRQFCKDSSAVECYKLEFEDDLPYWQAIALPQPKPSNSGVSSGDAVVVVTGPWLEWAETVRSKLQREVADSSEREGPRYWKKTTQLKSIRAAIADMRWMSNVFQVMGRSDDGLVIIQQLNEEGDCPLESGIKKMVPSQCLSVLEEGWQDEIPAKPFTVCATPRKDLPRWRLLQDDPTLPLQVGDVVHKAWAIAQESGSKRVDGKYINYRKGDRIPVEGWTGVVSAIYPGDRFLVDFGWDTEEVVSRADLDVWRYPEPPSIQLVEQKKPVAPVKDENDGQGLVFDRAIA